MICGRLLEGYSRGLELGGRPFVLEEAHSWMRAIAQSSLRDPVPYWGKMAQLPTYRGPLPKKVQKLFAQEFADTPSLYRVAHRTAGLGSLGRQRFAVVAQWKGGRIAREAKALVPSACAAALPAVSARAIHYRTLIGAAVRAPDPFVAVLEGWVVRRLAPDCARVELVDLPEHRDGARLLRAMGYETGNIHLGSGEVRHEILRDLARRPEGWLHQAVRRLRKAVTEDAERFRRSLPGPVPG
jgi:hypothetical protein